MIVIIVLAGVGFQLHRIEKKLESIWRYFKESD